MPERVTISRITREPISRGYTRITIDESNVSAADIPEGAIPYEIIVEAERIRAAEERQLQKNFWPAGLTEASQVRRVADLDRMHLLGRLPDGTVVVTFVSEEETTEDAFDYFARS